MEDKIIDVRPNQLAQSNFLKDTHRESLYIGGVGSGKTWAGARKFVAMTLANKCPGLISAPTYNILFQIMVPEIEAVCLEWGIPFKCNPVSSKWVKFCHLLIAGHVIYVMSCERPERITGIEVAHVWVDEAARIKTNDSIVTLDGPSQIRTRVRWSKSPCKHSIIWTSTPEGTDNWLYREFIETKPEDCGVYVGSTAKNRALPPSYVQSLLIKLSPEAAKQYLEGIPMSYAQNRAHKSFVADVMKDKNNITDKKMNDTVGFVGVDFNVSPCCAVFCQRDGNELYVLDEVVIEDNATVESLVKLMHEKGWGDGRKIMFVPDKSSKNRSMTGNTQFTVLMDTAHSLGWKASGSADGRNPDINDRINMVSTYILNMKGERNLKVHERCKRLISEFNKTGRTKTGAYDSGKKGEFGHILDAIGYVVWELFGEASPRFNKSSSIR